MRFPRCSVFLKATDKIPYGDLSLIDIVTTSHFKDKVLEYRRLRDLSGKRLKKLNLPAYTPSGIFSIRNARSLLIPSNVICVDIDGKDNPTISNTDQIKRIIGNLPFIWYCGDSVSGNGVFCLIKYENYRLHKLYFKALDQEFRQLGIAIDNHCSDISRLRFVSYDPDPIINSDAVVFTFVDNDDRIGNYEYMNRGQHTVCQPISESEKQDTIGEAILTQSYLINDNSRYDSKRCLIESIINKVILYKIDITFEYRDWFTIGCIINMMYGKSGRKKFHEISHYYPNYKESETDCLYDSIMSHNYLKKYDSMLAIVQKYNVFP